MTSNATSRMRAKEQALCLRWAPHIARGKRDPISYETADDTGEEVACSCVWIEGWQRQRGFSCVAFERWLDQRSVLREPRRRLCRSFGGAYEMSDHHDPKPFRRLRVSRIAHELARELHPSGRVAQSHPETRKCDEV